MVGLPGVLVYITSKIIELFYKRVLLLMDIARLSKIMKALSNKNRLEIFLKIARSHETGRKKETGCPVSDITRSLDIGAPTVSHHLKELINAGLITTEKRGRHLVARIIRKTMTDVRKVLNPDR